MPLFMGIDGGGSKLRVVIVDENLNTLTEASSGGVNPGVIGREAAADTIHATIRAALSEGALSPDDITAAAAGIAGAAASHSGAWLRDILGAVLPASLIVPSSDIEIALVGAHGERRGVLVLSGTGSVALGINGRGESAQAGGWGYLLGDEGSGYWIGLEALKTLARQHDATHDYGSSLPALVLDALGLAAPKDIIAWLYATPRTREVAGLAPLVLEAAASDKRAHAIIERAANELARLARTVTRRLDDENLPIAFAGGLLQNRNLLSEQLCARLGLAAFPTSRYSPVIGAARLAIHHWRDT